jgi:hypothetical protein
MQKLKVITYAPEHFGRLSERTQNLPADYPLRCRSFVDYYYASSEWCQLYLAIDEDGGIAGFQGVERMPFVDGENRYVLGFGSNFYAFKPGAGTYLLVNWMKTCDAGLVFGGSDDMNRLIDRCKWTRYSGVKFSFVNRRYDPVPENGWLRMHLKKLLKRAPFRRNLHQLAARIPQADVSVQEVKEFSSELLNFQSAFRFRFAADSDYLNWRYGSQVPFLRYRTFRVVEKGGTAGFVVVLDEPGQVVIAHADGSNPKSLATGIVQSISAVSGEPRDKREVLVVTSNPEMQAIFEMAGFKHKPSFNRPIAMGKVPGGFAVSSPVSEWLVSFGWGDNGVRPPFREPNLARSERIASVAAQIAETY